MSVCKMNKLTAFVALDDADEIMRRLMKMRCIDLNTEKLVSDEEESQDVYTDELSQLAIFKISENKRELDKKIIRIDTAITALQQYNTGKKKEKPVLDYEAFVNGDSYAAAWELVETTERITARRKELAVEYAAALTRLNEVEVWTDYDMPLDEKSQSTNYTFTLLGYFPYGTKKAVIDEAVEKSDAFIEYVNEEQSGIYVSVIGYNADRNAIIKTLCALSFTAVTFKDADNTAFTLKNRADKERIALDVEKEKLDVELREAAERIEEVRMLYDAEMTTLDNLRNKGTMRMTEKTAVITGWIPTERRDKVSGLLDGYAAAYEYTEPEEDDDVPILLKNNKFARNFEWVVGMYSYPKYGRYDPSFIMGIFYCILFGMMFADVGYGIILVIAGFAIPKWKKTSENMTRFFNMFGYCGISCVIMGVLFGSYFGDLPTVIMTKFFGVANPPPLYIICDPIKDSTTFLIIAIGMGAVHMLAGMAVKFYIICKDTNVLDAIFDVGSWWVAFAGIGVVFLNKTVGLILIGLGLLMILLTQGRKEKNFGGRLAKIFGALYGTINYATDLLSYSRILALGLASSVVAQIVNQFGAMGKGIVGGLISMTIAFLLGHTLNIGLNILGTFVHTSRLQYIEFFSKFYEDGGRPFEPAQPSEEYTKQKENN